MIRKIAVITCILFVSVMTYQVRAADVNAWTTPAGNPQRTGWTPENIPLNVYTKWVVPIEPYVSQRTQVIGASGKVYVSTAKGLYAFNADSGATAWTFPTELPLGEAPTFSNETLYVGGLDKNVYAIEAATGKQLWKFTGDAGFSTNPLVVNNTVYIGSRGGTMYALNASNGQKIFSVNTGSQILQSAAYNNNKIYFASLDGYAYALNSSSGSIVWKSAKLPGMGFRGWWPVVYQNTVIFTRTRFESGLRNIENDWLFTDKTEGKLPGNMAATTQWITGQPTVDLTANPNGKSIFDYIETNYQRRTTFFLNEATGAEITFDLDKDGKNDGAPILWAGGSGQLQPPIVSGFDNKLYFRTVNYASGAIPGAMASGWEYQTARISYPFSSFPGLSPDWPSDEQAGLSAAGTKIYYNLCCDRNAGAADLSIANSKFPDLTSGRQQRYITGNSNPPAPSLPAGYHKELEKFYWNPSGPAVYIEHTDNVGPAIYNGKVYLIRSNALIAMSADGKADGAPVLTSAKTQSASSANNGYTTTDLKTKLEQEVSKIVAAGHLKPSFVRFGLLNNFSDSDIDDRLFDYWHNPADVHYFLLRAYPFLTSGLQTQVKTYLNNEYNSFSPAIYTHIGYTSGVQRDPFIYPPFDTNAFSEVYEDATTSSGPFSGWNFPPHNIYAVWKLAQYNIIDSGALKLYDQVKNKLAPKITDNKTNLSDAYLAANPHVHNAYIAGYYGYVELAKLAGQPAAVYQPYLEELNRLLSLRVSNFTEFPTQNTATEQANNYFYTNLPAWNFMYMTPELTNYLKTNAKAKVLAVLDKYEQKAPYWMQAQNAEMQGENSISPYQITHGIFQANAKIRELNQSALSKYIDSPIVPVGDLFYIDNLVSAIESDGNTTPPPPPTCTPSEGDVNSSGKVEMLDLTALIGNYGKAGPAGDLNCDGKVNMRDISILLGNL